MFFPNYQLRKENTVFKASWCQGIYVHMYKWASFFFVQMYSCLFITVHNEVAKVMFLHLSGSYSVHRGGVSASLHAGIHHHSLPRDQKADIPPPMGPKGRHPPPRPKGRHPSPRPKGRHQSPPRPKGRHPSPRPKGRHQSPPRPKGRHPSPPDQKADTPLEQTPPPPSRRLLLRMVRILLECILVLVNFLLIYYKKVHVKIRRNKYLLLLLSKPKKTDNIYWLFIKSTKL